MNTRRLGWLVPLVLGGAFVVLLAVLLLGGSGSRRPGPFYAAPTRLPGGPPGTLIRKELIPHFYPGAKRTPACSTSPRAWTDAPPRSAGWWWTRKHQLAHGRKVIAFTHGMVGIARSCAPSLQRGNIGQVIEGLGEFIAEGYVVTASDYTGLGTAGRAPFLLGRVEAKNTLDAVRAAHRLRQAHAGVEFAVWGSSQGGAASFFTGQLAASYAPGLHLVGVAAGAPVPSLVELFRVGAKNPTGRVLLAMALDSWQEVFGDPRLQRIVAPAARPALAAVASYCLYGSGILGAVPTALALELDFRHRPPWASQPWSAIRAQATPGTAPIGVPILITQGGADKIVPARVTEGFVRRLCAMGETVDLRVYPSVEHREAGILAARRRGRLDRRTLRRDARAEHLRLSGAPRCDRRTATLGRAAPTPVAPPADDRPARSPS